MFRQLDLCNVEMYFLPLIAEKCFIFLQVLFWSAVLRHCQFHNFCQSLCWGSSRDFSQEFCCSKSFQLVNPWWVYHQLLGPGLTRQAILQKCTVPEHCVLAQPLADSTRDPYNRVTTQVDGIEKKTGRPHFWIIAMIKHPIVVWNTSAFFVPVPLMSLWP